MDLAQKANRVKRELQAATQRPEATSIRHAIDSFEAFVDGLVDEIAALKAALKESSPTTTESADSAEPAASERSEKELESTVSH